MAGKIEIRASGGKFRFVVLNRSGEKLMQSGQFDDKAGARRAASSLGKAVTGAEIVDATKPPVAAPKAANPAAAAAKAAKPLARKTAKPAARKTPPRRAGAKR